VPVLASISRAFGSRAQPGWYRHFTSG
jgi:hypothetical protein